MTLTIERIFTFKIHLILIDIIKRAIQISIEEEIRQKNDCKCESFVCDCVARYFERNFHTAVQLQEKRNYLKEVRAKIDKLKHEYFPNSLEIFDLTSLYSIAKNFLGIISDSDTLKIKELDDIQDEHITYPRSIDVIRNIRNIYYGHLDDYNTSSEKYERILSIFKQVLNKLNLKDNLVKKFVSQIDSIDRNDIIDSKLDDVRKSLIDEIRKSSMLKCDNIYYSSETNYILRNENEIIQKILNESNTKNKLILSQISGTGKTTMARHICKQLKDNHNFIIKWFETFDNDDKSMKDMIYFKYREILRDEFGYEIDSLKCKKSVIKSFSNELKSLLELKNDIRILFVIDNVKHEEQIREYIDDLPINIKILITTRNNDLLQNIENKETFQIKMLNKHDAFNYFMSINRIKMNFKEEHIVSIIDRIIKNDQITALKLNLAVAFIENNIKDNANKIIQEIGEKADLEEFYYIIIKSFNNNSIISKFLHRIIFLDTKFISFEVLRLIFDDLNEENLDEIIKLLKNNGLIDELRDEYGDYGIKLHDLIKNIAENESKRKGETETDMKRLCHNLSKNINSFNLIEKYYQHLINLTSNITLNDHYYCKILDKLGDYKFNCQYDYNGSIDLFVRKLSIQKILHKEKSEHDEIARSLNKIGLIYMNMGELEMSLKYYTESLEMREIVYKNQPYNRWIADSLNNIGLVYMYMGNYDECLKYYDKSLEIRKIINRPYINQYIAKSLNNKGLVYMIMGKYDDSLKCYKESLEIRKTINLNQQDNIEIANLSNNFGLLYMKMGEYNKSIEWYNESLEMRKRLFINQPNHPYIANSLNNIGLFYLIKGEYDQSLEYLNKSLKMRRKIFKNQPDHPCIANSLNNIGLVYMKMGERNKSLEYYEESLKMRKKIYTNQSTHPSLTSLLKRITSLENETSVENLNNELNEIYSQKKVFF